MKDTMPLELTVTFFLVFSKKLHIATNEMDLDLVPTKISSIEHDPSLMVTPEKTPSVLEAKKRRHAAELEAIPENELSHSILKPLNATKQFHLDPKLLVTPEKPQSVLKLKDKNDSDIVKKLPSKNHVRFDVPDSSEDTTSDSNSNANIVTDCSSISTEYEEGSSATLTDDTDFSIKAALYTQRNPLADITAGSNQTFDSLSTSESTGSQSNLMISNLDVQQSQPLKVVDLRSKINVEKPRSSDIIDVRAQKTLPIYKTKLSSSTDKGHRKPTSIQTKIDELTKTHSAVKDDVSNLSPKSERIAGKQSYLRKKTGLNRHEHSVKYIDATIEDSTKHSLTKPKYNTSLAVGQGLQVKSNTIMCV